MFVASAIFLDIGFKPVLPRILWIINVIRILLPRMWIIINVIQILVIITSIMAAVISMAVCIETTIWREDPGIGSSIKCPPTTIMVVAVVPLMAECNEATIVIQWHLLDHIKSPPKATSVVFATFQDIGSKLVRQTVTTTAAAGSIMACIGITTRRHIIINHQKDTYAVSAMCPVIGFKFVHRKRWINAIHLLRIWTVVVEVTILDLRIQFLPRVLLLVGWTGGFLIIIVRNRIISRIVFKSRRCSTLRNVIISKSRSNSIVVIKRKAMKDRLGLKVVNLSTPLVIIIMIHVDLVRSSDMVERWIISITMVKGALRIIGRSLIKEANKSLGMAVSNGIVTKDLEMTIVAACTTIEVVMA
mmetsp:Transcript_23143/g.35051  ORF Transcript_23143/g.35051 Transcript_23143/m.35051 type:complete len:359 (+) Transcript_23143:835-1911(+)